MTHDHMALDAITDVPGIKVGHWTNRRAATGCTVVLAPEHGAIGGIDVRGGAPGTRDTDLLKPGTLVDRVHAILLTGGSAFGLDAAGGVMQYLEEQHRGARVAGRSVPIVPAAVVFDLGIGSSTTRPDADAGYRATRAAKGGRVAQGSVGAGTGCAVAKSAGVERCLQGGVGSACERADGGLLVGALAVVNAVGDVVDPNSGRVIAGPRADGGGFLDGWQLVRDGKATGPSPRENTTLAVLATNARLDVGAATRLASVAHDGFARTIRPAHGLTDGDLIFTLATGGVEIEGLSQHRVLETMAVRAVERAIVRGVLCATSLAGIPSAQEWAAQSLGRS